MTEPTTLNAAPAFDPAFVQAITALFEQRIPFNRLLGLRLTELAPDAVCARIEMRPELIGNYAHNRIHGGVISAGLDTVGGVAVLAAVAARHIGAPLAQQLEHFARISTVDLRIDYLRPGVGSVFMLRGNVLRLGRRLANTRMEFLDADRRLLAAGSGVYVVA